MQTFVCACSNASLSEEYYYVLPDFENDVYSINLPNTGFHALATAILQWQNIYVVFHLYKLSRIIRSNDTSIEKCSLMISQRLTKLC